MDFLRIPNVSIYARSLHFVVKLKVQVQIVSIAPKCMSFNHQTNKDVDF